MLLLSKGVSVGKYIAIVDDHVSEREILKFVLEEINVDLPVLEFSDGESLIDFLEGSPRDGVQADACDIPVFFVDLAMPRVDGHEVIKHIRAHSSFNHATVCVMSNSKDSADIAKAGEAGSNKYIWKPGTVDAYKTVVLSVISPLMPFNPTLN